MKMINFYDEKICIDKKELNYNDKVLCLDICEYEEYNQIVLPFIATVKRTEDGIFYLECEEDDGFCLYADDHRYIVIKILG